MLIEEYIQYEIQYKLKYGKYTIILYQNGSFYEIYNINESDNTLQKICELLNIQFTRKNKSILQINKSNPSLAGFPLVSLKKYLTILLNNNYTVVLVEQITEPPNPERGVTNIYSPCTYIETITEPYSNIIVSLYITQQQCMKKLKQLYIYSFSCIDISTGQSSIYQSNNYIYDKYVMFDDMNRYIDIVNCKELIIHTHELTDITEQEIIQYLHTQHRILHMSYNKIENKYFNIIYCNDFLARIYKTDNFLTPIEYLNLEKYQETVTSFVLLLNFCYEHNERIIEKIKKPVEYEYNNHLIMYNNAIYQLDIIESNKYKDNDYKSLFTILNKCSTHLGKRLLYYRILNPITGINELNRRYEQIQSILDQNKTTQMNILLKNMCDMERFHRKMSLKMLHPHEFQTLIYTYQNIIVLIDYIDNLELFNINHTIIATFKEYIHNYEKVLNINELGKYGLSNINESFFNKNIYQEIDCFQKEIDEIKNYFNEEIIFLSSFIDKNVDNYIKLDSNDREGYFFTTTKTRSDLMWKNMKEEHKKKYEIRKFNNTVKIFSKELQSKSTSLLEFQNKISCLVKENYLNFLSKMYDDYHGIFTKLCEFISILDVSISGALCALCYKYVRPTIDDKYNGNSYFNIESIRHPIIEVVNTEYEYITNDISLLNEDNSESSILIYGLNSSGKSSLIKAVCLNIVMAQIGYYVSSSTFVFYPYYKMFVRISCDDNLYKGLSSYAVEINELRLILEHADQHSIVVSDELCKGTESMSGISICASTLIHFCKKKIHYLNTTHLHELYELDIIKELKNVSIKHINVYYDENNQNIIYLRKLENGLPKNKYYGLEFASYLIKDNDFIQDAYKIRNQLVNKNEDFISFKKSQYNNDLLMISCSICGEKADDSHHIKFQSLFDDLDINKHKLSNLVVLCKKHHNQVHNNELTIDGYVNTLKGKQLISNECLIPKTKKKYNETHINIIKDLSTKMNAINILYELKKNHNINMSKKILDKILNDKY